MKLEKQLLNLSKQKMSDFLLKYEDEDRSFFQKKHILNEVWEEFIKDEVFSLELQEEIHDYVKRCKLLKEMK